MAEMERSLLEVIDAALEEIRPMSTKRARDIAEVRPSVVAVGLAMTACCR